MIKRVKHEIRISKLETNSKVRMTEIRMRPSSVVGGENLLSGGLEQVLEVVFVLSPPFFPVADVAVFVSAVVFEVVLWFDVVFVCCDCGLDGWAVFGVSAERVGEGGRDGFAQGRYGGCADCDFGVVEQLDHFGDAVGVVADPEDVGKGGSHGGAGFYGGNVQGAADEGRIVEVAYAAVGGAVGAAEEAAFFEVDQEAPGCGVDGFEQAEFGWGRGEVGRAVAGFGGVGVDFGGVGAEDFEGSPDRWGGVGLEGGDYGGVADDGFDVVGEFFKGGGGVVEAAVEFEAVVVGRGAGAVPAGGDAADYGVGDEADFFGGLEADEGVGAFSGGEEFI